MKPGNRTAASDDWFRVGDAPRQPIEGAIVKSMRTTALVAMLMLAIAACGVDAASGVEVDGAWARTSPAMASAGVAYMDLTAPEDDELVSAAVDDSIAGAVEVHETVLAEHTGDSVSDDTMAGMGEMMMQRVDGIQLPAGETVSLQPGGYHIMLLDLAAPLETGQTFDLTLTFANEGEQVVTVEVGDSSP